MFKKINGDPKQVSDSQESEENHLHTGGDKETEKHQERAELGD